MIAQIQAGKWQSTQITADYKGDASSTSLTLGNPDLIHGSGVGVLHYLRTVTPSLALGAELAYQVKIQTLIAFLVSFNSSPSKMLLFQISNLTKPDNQWPVQ